MSDGLAASMTQEFLPTLILFEKASNGTILPSDSVRTIGETTIPLYIIGDSA